MKRILTIAYCIMVSVAFVSCTNDEDELKPSVAKFKTSADAPPDPTGGDQTGQLPVPRPK